MKNLTLLVLASVLGGAVALGSYSLFFDNQNTSKEQVHHVESHQISSDSMEDSANQPTRLVSNNHGYSPMNNPDFVNAAEKTVHTVVHVKNLEVRSAPRNLTEYLMGVRAGKVLRGMGSGVVITPDGYIVTNNHVIEGASELEVTLNNNKTYTAKVVGADKQEDIALLKIEAENLDYLPFGNSDRTKVGQWVLAVGNPFNLTSTVTAGIISAKGRNLNEGGTKLQSFIQTDAAINPGNSGGALVNTNGELIGINSAITSKTGSYIGYSFAIPSNNARKIVEDLMEFGDVKYGILGITGNTIQAEQAKEMGLSLTQGVYVAEVSEGAEKAGIRSGDLITAVDGVKVRKMNDLGAYIGTKRPGDVVKITYSRNKKEREASVKLTEYDTYIIEGASLEVVNAKKDYLKQFHTDIGVRIAQATSQYVKIPQDQYVIIAIDGKTVGSVDEVKKIMSDKEDMERTQITFQNRRGQQETLTF